MNINSMSLNLGADAILVDISVLEGFTLTGVKLWTKDTYKNSTEAIDLLSLAPDTIGDLDFIISVNDLDEVSIFSGIFFIEFTETEIVEPEVEPTVSTQLGLVANYTSYHECMVDRALEVEVENCRIQEPSCSKKNNVFFISTLIDSLYTVTLFGLYSEAIKIINTLDELCVNCSSCPDLGGTPPMLGLGFNTTNNQITKI